MPLRPPAAGAPAVDVVTAPSAGAQDESGVRARARAFAVPLIVQSYGIFAVGLIGSGVTGPMAAVMAAGMTPPIGLALATKLFPNRWTTDEHGSAAPALVLGLSFITEGAIPFAAADPLRVIPTICFGSAVGSVIAMLSGVADHAPHGGPIVLPVIDNRLMYLVSIAVGVMVTALLINFLKARSGQHVETASSESV